MPWQNACLHIIIRKYGVLTSFDDNMKVYIFCKFIIINFTNLLLVDARACWCIIILFDHRMYDLAMDAHKHICHRKT